MNRIAILVSCHRVLRADGSLGGYGRGLWRKRRLLALERRPVSDRLVRPGGPPGFRDGD